MRQKTSAFLPPLSYVAVVVKRPASHANQKTPWPKGSETQLGNSPEDKPPRLDPKTGMVAVVTLPHNYSSVRLRFPSP